MPNHAASTVVVAAGLLAAAAVHADTRTLVSQANAVGPCQAALPSFEGLVRKRPAALVNEGAANAFVTCSPDTFQGMPSGGDHYGLLFRNYNADAITITCTAVFADGAGNPGWSMPKSVTLAANSTAQLWWNAIDNVPVGNNMSFNTSCALPPGGAITTVFRNQLLDVGA